MVMLVEYTRIIEMVKFKVFFQLLFFDHGYLDCYHTCIYLIFIMLKKNILKPNSHRFSLTTTYLKISGNRWEKIVWCKPPQMFLIKKICRFFIDLGKQIANDEHQTCLIPWDPTIIPDKSSFSCHISHGYRFHGLHMKSIMHSTYKH